MPDPIIELLKNPKVRDEIASRLANTYDDTIRAHDDPEQDPESWQTPFRLRKAWFSFFDEIPFYYGDFYDEFENLIKRIPKPRRITPHELANALELLAGPHDRVCADGSPWCLERVYDVFLNYVSNSLLAHRKSPRFKVRELRHEPEETDLANIKTFLEESAGVIWERNGVRVRIDVDIRADISQRKRTLAISIFVDGDMSEGACEDLFKEITPVAKSVVYSLLLLDPEPLDLWGFFDSTRNTKAKLIAMQGPKPSLAGALAWLTNNRAFSQACLDAYYADPTGKGSIGRRICNAVRLLAESDAQSNDAVALALSVSAIEALLGQKGSEMVEKLADNVGVLLEPNPDERYNATQFVKKMYDIRSSTLHGEKLEGENKQRVAARRLAAGVLAAIICRRGFLKRAGHQPETPDDLLGELRKVRFDRGQPMGVDELNVVQLWRTSNGN